MLGFLLYPIIFPLHIFKPIYGKIGFPFFVFTYIDGTITYDEWACHFFFFYLIYLIFPATLYISTLPYKKTFAHYINFFDIFVGIVGLNVVNYRWVGEAVIIPFLFLNPTYVIIPFCIQIIVCMYGYPKQQNAENNVTTITPITTTTPTTSTISIVQIKPKIPITPNITIKPKTPITPIIPIIPNGLDKDKGGLTQNKFIQNGLK